MKNMRIFSILFLSVLLTFCGGKSDKDLFDNALTNVDEKKYDEAVVLFEQLVNSNKESELAPKALFECAKIYQGQVVKNLTGKESLLKSVEFYKRIYDEYPKSKEAENSLFMAGFILANDLKDLNKAKEMYETYIANFPDGELSDDAKVELQNLGKTPEEILKEKVQEDSSNEKRI
ncbi:MAG: tetratricopeptide repeat protein [Ignavibacteriales bacterium]|nr:tetratricopeptide repeat protein [Ignavibacteriales bacterium]